MYIINIFLTKFIYFLKLCLQRKEYKNIHFYKLNEMKNFHLHLTKLSIFKNLLSYTHTQNDSLT